MPWRARRIPSRRRLSAAGKDEVGADLLRERFDPLLEGLALISERDLGALVGDGLGDPPGDRAVLAAPSTSPRLPAINLGASTIALPESPRFNTGSTSRKGESPPMVWD